MFGVGSDPDVRDSLANERTFLAWVRTALALVAGAVAVASPALGFARTPRLALSLGLLLVATAAVGVGWDRWSRTEIALRTERDRPGFTGGMVFLGAVAVLLASGFIAALIGH